MSGHTDSILPFKFQSSSLLVVPGFTAGTLLCLSDGFDRHLNIFIHAIFLLSMLKFVREADQGESGMSLSASNPRILHVAVTTSEPLLRTRTNEPHIYKGDLEKCMYTSHIDMSPLASQIASVAYTAFLFTKSDIKTTVIPVTFFAASAAPIVDWTRLPHILLWIWFHVFQFDVSNQTLNPDEDALNKRDRPLPSGRITLRHAVVLRWILIPLCFALSGCYSIEAVYASIALVALTIVCDEMHAHAAHWIIRNSVNALGFASFEVGATLVGGVNSHALDCTGVLAVCVSTGIFATTIRAQDFKDEDGDRAVGRRTVPIVFPTCGRWTVIVPLIAWSSCLGVVWELDGMTAIAFMTLALYVGGQFVSLSAVSDDQVSFYWYNAWLSAAHALPGYYRIWGKV